MITDRELKKAVSALENNQKVFVGDRTGLYLRKRGQSLNWQLQYTNAEGKLSTKSFGNYPAISLREARFACAEFRILISGGHFPESQKQKAKSSVRFEDIVEDWKIQKYAQKSKDYIKQGNFLLKSQILPAIGSKFISEISKKDLLDIIRKKESEGKYATATRIQGILKSVFEYAKVLELIDVDPTLDLRKAMQKAPKTVHHACILDRARLGEVLTILHEGKKGSIETQTCLKLMPYLFVRSGELRGAKWDEFDLEKRLWSIPAERMKMRKTHIVPLSTQVIEIIEAYKEIAKDSEYLFPGRVSPYLERDTILLAQRNLGISKEDCDIHGWRATASTLLEEDGHFPSQLIEHALAHAVGSQVQRAYRHTTLLEERKVMMQWWADYLDALRDKKQPPESPVSIYQ